MNNKDFMRACVTGRMAAPTSRNRSGYREASNVLYDGEHVYSYGRHYPLLMRLETAEGVRWVLNDRGYSPSTGRHISHAGGLVDARVHLGRGMRPDAADIKASANTELLEIAEYIEETQAKAVKRPQHGNFYARNIERAEDRKRNLYHVIRICEEAEAFARNQRDSA